MGIARAIGTTIGMAMSLADIMTYYSYGLDCDLAAMLSRRCGFVGRGS
eukprot:COSAG05_NODE_17258_length_328_cov_1.611354_1_plen_47_part_01